jgi:PTH1 family peptidyl-tRNA hydrolase
MTGKKVCLIIGLGNPGDRYRNTRHNMGFMVVDKIADDLSISLTKNKFQAVYGKGQIHGIDVFLIKPMTYMNKSGFSIGRFANFYKVSNRDIVVIHDDIDLDFGRIKIKEKGGDGGHRGIRSTLDALGGDEFCRLRMGVGRSGFDIDVSDHVLRPFNAEEQSVLKQFIEKARDAVVTILCKGTKEGMNRFNNSKIVISS